MTKKPETLFKERVLKDLKLLGYFFKIQQVSLRGTPDILGLIKGRFIAIELKKDKNAHVDKLQLEKLVNIRNNGGIALLTYPEIWDDTLEILKNIE